MDISNVYERSCFPAAAQLARVLSQTSRMTYEGSTLEWYTKSKFVRCGRPTGRPLHIKELSFLGVSLVWSESSFYVPLPAPWLLCAFVFLCFCFALWFRVCALLPVYDLAASPRRAPQSLALQLHLLPSTTPLQVNKPIPWDCDMKCVSLADFWHRPLEVGSLRGRLPPPPVFHLSKLDLSGDVPRNTGGTLRPSLSRTGFGERR